MIDLNANRIKCKDKRHVEMDESKDVGVAGKMLTALIQGVAFLRIRPCTENATSLFKMYKLLAKMFGMHKCSIS